MLGIIAGGGTLPRRLADACISSHRDYFIIALENACDIGAIDELPHAVVRLGAVGEALAHLKAAGVQEVVMAGGVARPSMTSLMPDAVGAKLIARLGLKLFSGDDALLKGIISFLEEEGFRVVGIDDVLGGIVAQAEQLSARKPDAQALKDIEQGLRVVRALGAVDVGQGAVVENGYVLGVEAAEGTDALITRCGALQREPGRGVLVKASKPGQEARVDLPTVGPKTLHALHEAGLLGVAYAAGCTLLVERDEVVRLAKEYDLLVLGVNA